MSLADSAEYQREQLAKALNELLVRLGRNQATDSYRKGYLDAVDDIADAMNLTVTKVYVA